MPGTSCPDLHLATGKVAHISAQAMRGGSLAREVAESNPLDAALDHNPNAVASGVGDALIHPWSSLKLHRCEAPKSLSETKIDDLPTDCQKVLQAARQTATPSPIES